MKSDSKSTLKNKERLLSNLKDYRRKYLIKKYETLDESATRLMVNYFLIDILGYTQLDEVKTEYAIKGTYADYVIQIARKKWFIVEVKSIQIDLSENHLRQALSYAANEGIDWVILTNGKEFELYKVIFSKPISHKKLFSFNLSNLGELKEAASYFYYLTKASIVKKEIEDFWTRFQALEPKNLAKLLYLPEIVSILRRKLKINTGINFSEEDVIDSIYQVVVLKVESSKPRVKSKVEPKAVKPVLAPLVEGKKDVIAN